ncbi:hypothetical protein EVAR_2781_1 [Eumeta japonica]|uniref:Uncharacterized protein n=1 Tax=Eumeta variegata TaxID=151549 RepID=A0A4C1SZM8_EUMVA|nr:hypothetical protein EVAR_2781_1 [Eumeta japonica]
MYCSDAFYNALFATPKAVATTSIVSAGPVLREASAVAACSRASAQFHRSSGTAKLIDVVTSFVGIYTRLRVRRRYKPNGRVWIYYGDLKPMRSPSGLVKPIRRRDKIYLAWTLLLLIATTPTSREQNATIRSGARVCPAASSAAATLRRAAFDRNFTAKHTVFDLSITWHSIAERLANKFNGQTELTNWLTYSQTSPGAVQAGAALAACRIMPPSPSRTGHSPSPATGTPVLSGTRVTNTHGRLALAVRRDWH